MPYSFAAAPVIRSVTILLLTVYIAVGAYAQSFRHPGIDQTSGDLELLKQYIQEGRQPYKAAFLRLKEVADTPFIVRSHAHVLRGPYGKPNIGGEDLRNGANFAYDNALLWYITGEQKFADRSISILNAWSGTLWDFDFNDAKLLAAWTGHLLCNAAELLKYSRSGWLEKDQEAFKKMLQTVYYPLLRYYYPQANGNWDGAIIHSIMAMGIFLDNRNMFDDAVNHYLRAPYNGSIFRYVYPNGQCQESPRDQGHVQLGLGEFAGAAQVAFSQGVDLFSAGNHRLAQGYEFTSRYLMGDSLDCYCIISPRAKTIRDDYETISAHYDALGIVLPFTKKAADSVRPKAIRSILSAVRKPVKQVLAKSTLQPPYKNGKLSGASKLAENKILNDVIAVKPGESVQEAIYIGAQNGKWVMLLAGIHQLNESLKIPSNTRLSGEGASTILFLSPSSSSRDLLVNENPNVSNITICNMVIEGSNRTDPGQDPNATRSFRGGYNRGGIVFRANLEGEIQNMTLENLTVRNCTYNGVFISGGTNIRIQNCDLNENGGNVVPGPRLQHNLLLSHCNKVTISDSRIATSPFGAGIALEKSANITIQNNEIARNAFHGILITESRELAIQDNLIEANDGHGIMLPFLYSGSQHVTIKTNLIHYNTGKGVVAHGVTALNLSANTLEGNTSGTAQTDISQLRKLHIGEEN